MGKKKRKRRSPPPPMAIGAISTNFYSAGDRTEQTKEHIIKRAREQQQNQDCYVEEEEDEEEIEIKELPHKDFNATKKWKGRALLERMGWKEGEGLGRKKEGVLNPITPDERYSNSKMGLGTPQEVRLGIVAPQEAPQEWPTGTSNSTSPIPWALPSYLNKKHYKKGQITIPNTDLVAILEKRLNTLELNLAKGGEKHYSAVPFEKMQLKKVWEQIAQYKNEKCNDLLLEIGWWIHLQAIKEALSDVKLYKEEVARLWYYVDLQVGGKHSYLTFLNDVKERVEAQLYTDFGADDNNKTEVIISDDDDDVIELFGQKTKPKAKKRPKLAKVKKEADVIVLD